MKTKTRKTVIITLVAILAILLVGLVVGLTANSVKEKETIKVGFSLPLSGFASQYGERYERGLDLALEELQEKSDYKFEFIIEDDKCSAGEAAQVANRFFNVEDLHIQLVMCAASAPVFATHADKNKDIIFINSIRTEEFSEKQDYILNMYPSANSEMKRLAEHIFYTEKIERVVVINQRDFFGETYKNKFIQNFEALGGEVVLVESYEPSATKDYKTSLLKVQENKVTAIVNFLAHPNTYEILLRQTKELGLNLRFFGPYYTEHPLLIANAGSLANGLVYSYNLKEPETAKYLAFKQKYKERFGEDPENYARTSYEFVNLLIQLLDDCDQDTRCMVNHLNSGKSYENFGETIRFKNFERDKKIHMKAIEQGKFVYI